jgi:arylsulfatase A-like enzyme
MKNVVLLTIDTLRRDVLGCYGGGSLTPFTDSIQNKCIRFEQAYSPGPYTRAAFPGLLTSSHYLEFGKEKKLGKTRVLISEVLKKAGIATAAFHSNPYLTEYMGWKRGWDIFYDSMQEKVDPKVPYIKAERINRKVNTWLPSHLGLGGGKPFFLWLHYMDVHEPYVPPRKYIDLIDPSIMLGEEDMFQLFKEVLLKRDASDPGKVELLKKLYWAHVREVDDATREFFGMLERLNLLKDTVIVVTTDHGDEFGEHGGLSHDGKLYDELVHVPLLIYDPTRERNEVSGTLVSTLDVSPTIAYLLGVEAPQAFEGRSLLPLESYPVKGVFGEAVDKHGSDEKGEEKEVHYYREGDLKIIYRERDDVWELYSLKDDPEELRNIVASSPMAEPMKDKIRPRVRRYERR